MSDDYFKYLPVQEDTMLLWVQAASKHMYKEPRRVVEVLRQNGGGYLVVSTPGDSVAETPVNPTHQHRDFCGALRGLPCICDATPLETKGDQG